MGIVTGRYYRDIEHNEGWVLLVASNIETYQTGWVLLIVNVDIENSETMGTISGR